MKPIEQVIAAAMEATAPGHGGKRRGAGRKRVADRALVPHRARPAHDADIPVLVTLRAKEGLPSFRSDRIAELVRSTLLCQQKRGYATRFQVVELAIQQNELHVIVEAADDKSLRSGVSGLAIAFARRFNAMFGSAGRIWADRWNGRLLESPKEVRDALVYMFRDVARHDPRLGAPGTWPDNRPRTWLLEAGWQAAASAAK